MFENPSAASSPEPRGRSPGARVNIDNNRPTSKVRASFVSVEPSGHTTRDLGTTKGTADGVNSTQANRRESFSVSEEPGENTVAELKREISHEAEARKNSVEIAETIPEQAVETRESSRVPPPIRKTEDTMPNLGSIMKGSDFPEPETGGEKTPQAAASIAQAATEPDTNTDNIEEKLGALSLADAPPDNPDKVVTGAQEEASLKPADPKDETTVSGGEGLPPPVEVLPSTNAEATPKATQAVQNTSSKAKANGASSAVTPSGTKTSVTKPPAISTAKASAAKPSSSRSPLPKSPGFAKLPKTPTTPRAAPSMSSAKAATPAKEQSKGTTTKEPTKAPVAKTSRSSLRASTTSTTTSAAAKAKVPVAENKKPASRSSTAAPAPKGNTNTSPGGFKKPRPKSPTRPVRLPSHLVAPTASSAAKHGDDGTQKLARKTSTISRPIPPKPIPAVARKPAPRASLAPSTAPAKRPESRTSTRGATDESFLARMMRPTASSASKTHDKPASPPRRGASVRALNKPKPGQESAMEKGKKKVGEIVSKAKDLVTNGHSEEHHAEGFEPSASNGATAEVGDEHTQPVEPDRASVPAEQVESSAVELPTQNIEGQEVR